MPSVIVINHLTRMHHGHVCAAGVDLATHRHIRFVGVQEGLRAACLQCHGGPFEMGEAIVLEGLTRYPRCSKPHIEDHLFRKGDFLGHFQVKAEILWRAMEKVAQPDLETIFGADAGPIGGVAYGTVEGRGECSLGCLRTRSRVRLYVKEREGRPSQVRLELGHQRERLNLPVTDLRLYHADHETPDQAKAAAVAEQIAGEGEHLLSVGLGRAYAVEKGQPAHHYLQVNNVHLVANPLWRMGETP